MVRDLRGVKIAVFDLDGTLSDGSQREHFLNTPGEKKRWKEYFDDCHNDTPIWDVINVHQALCIAGWHTEIWSGRSEIVRDKTIDWLRKVGINTGEFPNQVPLRMRGKNDYRDDREVKGDMLDRFMRDTQRIPCIIFDDRNKMVEFWREKGITCAQTALGDF